MHAYSYKKYALYKFCKSFVSCLYSHNKGVERVNEKSYKSYKSIYLSIYLYIYPSIYVRHADVKLNYSNNSTWN